MADISKGTSPTSSLLGKFQHMVYRIFFMPESSGSTFLTTHQGNPLFVCLCSPVNYMLIHLLTHYFKMDS